MGDAAEGIWNGEDIDTTGWPGLESLRCDHCGTAGARLLRCTVCRSAFFCNRECQRAGWPRHRDFCGQRQGARSSTASSSGSPVSSAPGSPRLPGAAAEAMRRGLSNFNGQRYREALADAEEAAAGATAEGLWEMRCEALRLRGQCFLQLSDFAKAKEALSEALSEARSKLLGTTAKTVEANVLLRLGAVATRSSELGIAIQYQRKAIALLESDSGEKDKDSLAGAYNNLAISTSKVGLLDEAKASFEKAAALREETGHLEGLCTCSTNLANILRLQDRAEEAAVHLERARQMACERGNRHLEKQVLQNLANLYENSFEDSQDGAASATSAAPAIPPAPEQSAAQANAAVRTQQATTALQEAQDAAALQRERLVDAEKALAEAQARVDALRQDLVVCDGVVEERSRELAESEAAEKESELAEAEAAEKESREDASATYSGKALQCRCDLLGFPNRTIPEKLEAKLQCGYCQIDLHGQPKRLRCGRCRLAFYCNVECQRAAWQEHSGSCKAPVRPSEAETEARDRHCPICLTELNLLASTTTTGRVMVLQCYHWLHTECWKSCQESGQGGCPVCRDSIAFMA